MRISRKLLLAIFLIGLIGSVKAQLKLENSIFWEISGNGLKKPSYLYGTFHVRDRRVFQFDKVVYKKLSKCDVVTGELNMNMGKMLFSLIGQIHKLFLPNGLKLKDLYDNEEDYLIVKNYLEEKLGPIASMADSLQPIMTSSMVSEASNGESGEGFGHDYKYVLDDHFQRVGKLKGKEIEGLETMEEQLDAIMGIEPKNQAQMLLEEIKSEGQDEGLTPANMIAIYVSQNITKLDSLVNGMSTDDFSESLLYKRNRVMADRIDNLIQKKRVFNTFGAAHLGGEYGIINLLRLKGYTVTPIFFEFNENNKPIDTSKK